MSSPKISWEIVLAGLTFAGIGIYLLNHNSSTRRHHTEAKVWHSKHKTPNAPDEPSLPGAIVIDLKNLDNLKNLEDLKKLKNLDQLKDIEIKLKNLDKVINEQSSQKAQIKENVDQSLQQLESQLQKIGGADYNVKLQNQKVYINKKYNVDEGKWSEVSAGIYVFRESFPVADIKSINLDLGFGNVNIVGGDSKNAEITLRATGNVDDPATLSKEMVVQKNMDAPNASFKIHPSGSINLSDKINMEATLTLPKNIQINAQTSGGHITAENLSNNQVLRTSGGHISLDEIQGKTVARTEGGHITGDRLSGNILLSTGGGHIQVDKFQGSLSAKTAGGHIEIQDGEGTVNAKTAGGNISVSMSKVDGPLRFSTSAGNINLYLPQDLAASLNASGTTVTLSDAFNFKGTKAKGHITGKINDGSLPLVVDCEYGNVYINPKQ
ncbi:MAG TPA: DUF4097 family beta strand repeat-containing protein [Balneolaceae bacterium]|nr:DUF4097 family beta strand repeat-containing protein [Balneolaceae bacterium]